MSTSVGPTHNSERVPSHAMQYSSADEHSDQLWGLTLRGGLSGVRHAVDAQCNTLSGSK